MEPQDISCISVADGKLQFGKLLNFENGSMEEVERTSQTCPMSTHRLKISLGKAANQPRIRTIRSRLHGICTTQPSMKDLQIQNLECPSMFFSHTHMIHGCAVEVLVILGKVRPEAKQSVECDWLRGD